MDNMEGYQITKKMKIMAFIAFPLSFILMVLFLLSILVIKNNVVIIIFTVLFVASMLFEGYVIILFLKKWYKNYTDKYNGL